MSQRRIINLYYIERRYFSDEHPTGFMCESVVVDDDKFTVTEGFLRSEDAEIQALPLSDLIEAKRLGGLYDADFEERISKIWLMKNAWRNFVGTSFSQLVSVASLRILPA